MVAGKGAIRPLYEAVLKEFDFQGEGTVKEVVVSGDMGYFWSAYTLTATPKAGGEPMKVTGKSLFIVRREPGGAWKIARLMDNSDGVTTGQDNNRKANQTVQRTGASRLAQRHIQRHRRPAPVADLCRSAALILSCVRETTELIRSSCVGCARLPTCRAGDATGRSNPYGRFLGLQRLEGRDQRRWSGPTLLVLGWSLSHGQPVGRIGAPPRRRSS